MTDKRAGQDFETSRGSREFEVFMLPDKVRKEFFKLRDEAGKELEQLRKDQRGRSEEDVRTAKREIGVQQLKPILAPSWARRRGPNAHEVKAAAEQLVFLRNEKAAEDLKLIHRQREDDFLAREREERVFREMGRSSPSKDRTVEARRDFDKSRDRER